MCERENDEAINLLMEDTIFDGAQFNFSQLRLYLSGVLSQIKAFLQCFLYQLIFKVGLDVTCMRVCLCNANNY